MSGQGKQSELDPHLRHYLLLSIEALMSFLISTQKKKKKEYSMGIRTQENYAKLVYQMESLSNKLVIFILSKVPGQ